MATRTNLCTNPSMAAAITGITIVTGTGGTAAATYNAGAGYSGDGFARATWTVATSAVSGGLSCTQTGLAAATQYSHQVWVRSSKTQTVALAAVYKTAAAATVNTVTGASTALVANTWTLLTVTGTSGALVDRVVLTAAAVAGGANWAAADTLDLDAVCIETGATAGNFFDGTTASAAWNGTANASTSTLYIPVITLTAYTDANPSPRVLAVLTDTAPQVQTVNVQRTAEGRTMKVRGGVSLFAVGGAAVMDFETPFGIPAVYQAEQFDVNGLSLGFTDPATVTLDVTDTWVHQPLSPTLAVKARLFIDSANDLVRPAPGSVVWTEGATVGRLIGGQRVGLRGTSIRLRMANAADADELLSMFGGYTSDFPSVICIRTPTTIRLPRVLFAGCLDPHEVDYGNYAMITMAMTIDEVAPPAPGLVLPTLRRKDIDAAFPTRAARAAAYATRLARDVDYSKSGLAG